MIDNSDLLSETTTESNEELLAKKKEHFPDEDSIYIQNDIHQFAKKIASFDVAIFYKEAGYADGHEAKSFKKDEQAISYVIELASFIVNVHQQEAIKLSREILHDIRNDLSGLDNLLRDMRNFYEQDVPNGGFQEENITLIKIRRNKLSDQLHEQLFIFQKNTTPLITLVSRNEVIGLKEQVNRLTDGQTKQAIEKHHELYEESAGRHFKAGWFWLTVGVALVVAAGVLGYETMDKAEALIESYKPEMGNLPIALISLRIFLFGFLTSLVFWSFKNYRLNKHNELLNRQKALALQTFTAFSNAASTDNDMRRAVLGKVTTTIFDVHNMGYIRGDNKSETNENDALNVLANLTTRKDTA